MIERSKISILFIIGSTNLGGVPTFVFNLIKNLNKRIFFNVELIAPNDGQHFEKFYGLIKVHNKRIRGFYPETLFFIRKLIKEKPFNIVYANGRGAGLYGRLAAMGTGVKVVYSYHGFHYDHFSGVKKILYLGFEKALLNRTDKVVCVSQGEKEEAIESGLLTEEKAVVIPYGIDFDRVKADRTKKTGHTIGMLTKICAQKGIEYVVQAAALLKGRYPDLRCLVAGKTLKEDLDREAEIKKAIKVSGLEQVVVLLGEVVDIEKFFHEIDIYASAALWEGLPMALLEAFALRVPVVATDVVGNGDLVVHKKTGVLVEPESGRSLADGIDFAFRNRDKMKIYADNAHRFVRQNYSMQTMVENHRKLYTGLVDDFTNDQNKLPDPGEVG